MLQAGARLGNRYHLQQRLGAGGMGEVWLAVDEVLRRTVAVKAMLPSVAGDPDFAKRFEAEATSMARIHHPAVAAVHDFGQSEGLLFLVMEYVDGESLAQRLVRGRLSPEETMRLLEQAATGLQAVHEQGLVHRDIKPANLLVRRNGTVVITDFGIARHENASHLTVSGAILGTPTYLSPEQVRGEPAGPLSDVYSLGLVAYECLAGEKPFVGDSPYAVALQRLQSGPRTIKVELPVAVQAVVERALAVEPRDRWPSAAALASAARTAMAAHAPMAGNAGMAAHAGVAGSAPEAAGPPAAASPPPAGVRVPQRWPMLALTAVLLVVAGGAVAWGISLGAGDNDAVMRDPGQGQNQGQNQGQSQAREPVSFVACGDAYCPVVPMCWSGLVANSGVAVPPRPIDCSEPHYWETFRAVPLPAGGVTISDAAPLIERADAAEACSAAAMAERSREPAKTRRWQRDVWPITIGANTTLHCIASAPGGESTGGFFRQG
ncbi:serine/threonine-protein kinase [Actinoplanes sp. NEAU-A12]|uniref:non-specific serine/threonine protein kinase n=1 Tax=Actinoplanes sandaracinus TaxID=3045177 RepID=A0ABT6WRR2_9ACTN|nr:serine/threonine-protein kinase [Actinoplanes sandaracinus]MDI6102409.1 serine/threonine-protein kinase [Actinoplanes sandaracinus]